MRTTETERLILRPWRESDAQDMFAYARDPEVGPAAGWPPHTTVEVSRGIIRHFIEQDDVWAIVLRDTGRVIGSIGLHRDARRSCALAYSLGYVLAREHWGRGLMTEAARRALQYAFEDMHAVVVSAVHYPFNDRSRRVIEKLGLRYEGTLRRATARFDGALLDDVCYSLTREEYEQMRGEDR